LAAYDRDKIKEILDRTSLKDVVQEFVTLQKVGREYKGLCPFHQETAPSFHVIEHKKFFYCFGCQAGGDAVRFLQMAAGLTNAEAIRRLARRIGMELPEERPVDPAAEAAERKRADLLNANQAALAEFKAMLKGSGGETAREYLESRKIGPELIDRYELGFGGNDHGDLASALMRRKVPMRHAEEVGLVSRSRYGEGWYERFNGRIVCPVHDLDGSITGFSGRIIPPFKSDAKYTNNPDSPVFKKGINLFGLYQARAAIRHKKAIILVEGNFDVLAMAAAGYENVVAPLGTALTRSQVNRLKRFANVMVVVFDGDEAGRKAARKTVGLLVEAVVEGRVALLPPGEDPDSLVRAHGREKVEELLARSRPMISYLVEALIEVHGRTPHGIRKVVEEAGEVFSLDRDPIRFGLYREELARMLGLDVRQIRKQMRYPRAADESAEKAEPCPTSEKTLLELMLLFPRLIKRFVEEGEVSLITHPEARDIIGDIITMSQGGSEDPAEAIVSGAESGGPLRGEVLDVFRRPETYNQEMADGTFTETMADLERQALQRKRKELEVSLQKAENEGLNEEIRQTLSGINEINRRMAGMERKIVRQAGRPGAGSDIDGETGPPGPPIG